VQHEKLLRLPAVCAAVGMRKAGIYKAIRDGRFPQPIKLGVRASAWVASEVDAWISERIDTRNSGNTFQQRASRRDAEAV
jgi:prophage regulatory protein